MAGAACDRPGVGGDEIGKVDRSQIPQGFECWAGELAIIQKAKRNHVVFWSKI